MRVEIIERSPGFSPEIDVGLNDNGDVWVIPAGGDNFPAAATKYTISHTGEPHTGETFPVESNGASGFPLPMPESVVFHVIALTAADVEVGRMTMTVKF